MRVPWRETPASVVGYSAPVQIVARADNVVVALESVLAFRDGALLSFLVAVRRGSADRAAWEAWCEGKYLSDAAGGLEVSVQFPDGSRASNRDRARSADAPDAPVLSEADSDFSSDGTYLDGHRDLWLWPLPPPAQFILEIEWLDLGLRRVSGTLDGEAINRAAEHARPVWD